MYDAASLDSDITYRRDGACKDHGGVKSWDK